MENDKESRGRQLNSPETESNDRAIESGVARPLATRKSRHRGLVLNELGINA